MCVRGRLSGEAGGSERALGVLMRLVGAGLGLLAGSIGHNASRRAIVGRWGALDGGCGLAVGEDG